MKKDIAEDLLQWKESNLRKPLLVRGARQVGKSHAITRFLQVILTHPGSFLPLSIPIYAIERLESLIQSCLQMTL